MDSFQPDAYPQYRDRWCEIITEVWNVYSGMVALKVINADDRLTFADELDALLITVFGGLYTTSGRLKDVRNPTMQELVKAQKITLTWHKISLDTFLFTMY